MDGIRELLATVQEEGVLPVDGVVEPEDYDAAKQTNQKYRDIFLGSAEDDEERELFSKLWPYQYTER